MKMKLFTSFFSLALGLVMLTTGANVANADTLTFSTLSGGDGSAFTSYSWANLCSYSDFGQLVSRHRRIWQPGSAFGDRFAGIQGLPK